LHQIGLGYALRSAVPVRDTSPTRATAKCSVSTQWHAYRMSRGRCECCERPNIELMVARVPNGLPSTPRFCGDCIRHLGDSPGRVKQRELDHLAVWRTELRTQLAARDALRTQQATSFQAEIDRLKHEMDSRPVRVVVENVDQQEVDAALTQKANAYNRRDVAMQALTRLHSRHYAVETRLVTVDFLTLSATSSRSWTGIRSCVTGKDQNSRARAGRSHMLPRGHPGIIDEVWESTSAAQDTRWRLSSG